VGRAAHLPFNLQPRDAVGASFFGALVLRSEGRVFMMAQLSLLEIFSCVPISEVAKSNTAWLMKIELTAALEPLQAFWARRQYSAGVNLTRRCARRPCRKERGTHMVGAASSSI